MSYYKYGIPDEDMIISEWHDPSYTIRAFNTYILDVDITELDIQYHTYWQNTNSGWQNSSEYYFGGSVPSVGTVFIGNQENWVYPNVPQSTLNTYTQLTLDQLTQLQLETGIPVSDDANGKNNDGLSVIVNGTAEFDSFVEESLVDSPFDSGEQYIQMAIWDFPGTSDASRLDLAASSITFSSSRNYDESETVTIPFDSSELEIPFDFPTTSSEIWKINKEVLTNQSIPGSGIVDLEHMLRVKFTLVSTGPDPVVFKTSQMKMVKADYSHNYANANNKVGVLERETWPTISQEDMPHLIQSGLIIKDFSYIAKLSLRDLPEVGGTTTLSMVGRVNIGDYPVPEEATDSYPYLSEDIIYIPEFADLDILHLRSELVVTDSSVTIKMYEADSSYSYPAIVSTTEALTFEITKDATLSPDKEYFFVTNFKENRWESIVFTASENGDFAESIFFETGQQLILSSKLKGETEGYTGRGYAGYQFKPSEYGGFEIDYIYARNAVIAEYESKSFQSYTPVKAASLFPTSTPDIYILSGNINDFVRVTDTNNFMIPGKSETGFIASPQDPSKDDVLVEQDTTIVYDTQSIKVTKKNDAYIAAVQYNSTIKVNDFAKTIFKTQLRFNDILSTGEFRVVFWDKDRTRVLYMEPITGVVANEWNEVDIPLYTNLLFNNEFIIEIGHYGEIDPVPPITDPYGYFWLEKTELTVEAVEWEASNNDGLTYIPFLDALSGGYKQVNFASQNYYTSIINKSPHILWEFNSSALDKIIGIDNRNHVSGILVASDPLASVEDYRIDTPGTVTSNGTAYPVPASVANFQNNRALTLYGTADAYVETANNQTLTSLFGISPGSASPITASARFYSDTTDVDISLLNCEDAAGTATGSWDLSISGGTAIIFTCNGVGTVTSTIPNYADQQWHSACFAYSPEDNGLRIYWDGELSKYETLTADLTFDYDLKVLGPVGSFSPSSTYDNFDAANPFLFLDNVSVHSELLDQYEIYRDYIAAISFYNKLRVRARAYTTNAWIYGYELIPHYEKMNRLRETVNKTLRQTDQFYADDGSPQEGAYVLTDIIVDPEP